MEEGAAISGSSYFVAYFTAAGKRVTIYEPVSAAGDQRPPVLGATSRFRELVSTDDFALPAPGDKKQFRIARTGRRFQGALAPGEEPPEIQPGLGAAGRRWGGGRGAPTGRGITQSEQTSEPPPDSGGSNPPSCPHSVLETGRASVRGKGAALRRMRTFGTSARGDCGLYAVAGFPAAENLLGVPTYYLPDARSNVIVAVREAQALGGGVERH